MARVRPYEEFPLHVMKSSGCSSPWDKYYTKRRALNKAIPYGDEGSINTISRQIFAMIGNWILEGRKFNVRTVYREMHNRNSVWGCNAPGWKIRRAYKKLKEAGYCSVQRILEIREEENAIELIKRLVFRLCHRQPSLGAGVAFETAVSQVPGSLWLNKIRCYDAI